MSHTVPSQHPAVVLRSNYQHVRAFLAIAIAVILGLTVAVAVLATSSNHATLATQSPTQPNPSAEPGARLCHSGRCGKQTTDRLAGYPDAAPPSASTPQPSVGYYLETRSNP
jgi:cell division protein FtsN